jgi:hypothetical protein
MKLCVYLSNAVLGKRMFFGLPDPDPLVRGTLVKCMD